MSMSRRDLLQTTAALPATAAAAAPAPVQPFQDGPASARFRPVPLEGNTDPDSLTGARVSEAMAKAAARAPRGRTVSWGIPFDIGRVLLLDEPVTQKTPGLEAGWLVFLHTADFAPIERDARGFIREMRGEGRLGEHAADYVVQYADGTEVRQAIQRRHQIGMFRPIWGENCFQAVAHTKPYSLRSASEQPSMLVDAPGVNWGRAETRALSADRSAWTNWLWAWENPYPQKQIAAVRFEPKARGVVVSALSAGKASAHPLRWGTRRKAILRVPEDIVFDHRVDGQGRRSQIALDMGQVISSEPRLIYPNENWAGSYNNQLPAVAGNEVLVEYTAHPDAEFQFSTGTRTAVAELEKAAAAGPLVRVVRATRRVRIRVLDRPNGKPVPVKLHLHGEAGEYLAPADRHRLPNSGWFEDYAPEFQHMGRHRTAYIDGETVVDLPEGGAYLEVSKGFEIRPIRKKLSLPAGGDVIEIVAPKALNWRERGWVTADTHVHFLSPQTAWLEGAGEGVNVVNLLASQWGELMTNAGDFDGRTTLGSKEAGGDGEWLVRVGTENRQHVLGHISLLGYNGNIIAPMCAGGPDEAALGDPVGVLMMEWAERCRAQGGIVVLPHFPNPRCENAADIISGVIDGVEMTSWGNLYGGIDPYSLSDYYRYLNCGHFIAAVGGTDKMSASTAVGTVRTYALLPRDTEFTYDSWKAALRAGNTFVTYGPLMQFTVEGRPPGTRMEMKAGGGSVNVTWDLSSVTVPMTKVELVVNGEVRESRSVKPDQDSGSWSVPLTRSSWIALLVRGHYPGQPEIIAAHSSPVMVRVEGSEFFSAVDAVTMLDQIEGALAFVDTVGTRADDAVYKRIRMRLTAAFRQVHNQLHQHGHYHRHTAITEHT